jgi:lipoprotein-anchoring transpeptidase ErfK/SrfK
MKFRFLVALSFLVFAGFLIVDSSPWGKPCANSGSCKESLQLNVDNEDTGVFNGRKIIPPKIDLTEKVNPKKILGEETGTGEKHIYVDLTSQTLSAYQGNTLFMQVPISSGKWFPTPPGEYTIWEKIRATRMSGGEGADYYDLPNVPFVMFFSGPGVTAGRGFSLHGAYWHDNFGHAMSHGCVNMRTVDAEKLYYWTDPPVNGNGTKITIYGKAP